ncbi:MAG TPA: ANTAR domain-containing protein [Devosiaceae bacterium]|nr:ANTAR domain-containing protein [Devosiaceae bacterium]
MSARQLSPSFEQQRALILHRPHVTVDAIVRQLTQIGMAAELFWPDLPPNLEVGGYGAIFFDVDLGHDEQFPWPAGEAPIPAIALIGSEAPGRIAWAIRRGADAQLLKPITGGGIYSAVLIAREAFDRRRALSANVAALKARLDLREPLAQATALLMVAENISPKAAYDRLRRQAMAERLPIEALATRLLEAQRDQGRRHDRA